uniref:hypothetical protein n=1 Tax=Microbulbifer agarilyticus TaxID=260552 RepID=UPI0004926ABA|nr:hypothetical protein [Microbulbifer agarilyticus]
MALGFLLKAQTALAVSNEQHAINTFDGYCVQNKDDYSNIPPLAEAMGAMELPEEMLNADPAMRKLGGGGYGLRYEGLVFLIGFVNGGGCTVMSTGLKPAELDRLLKQFYGAEFLRKLDEGIQTTSFYTVRDPGPNQGVMFSIVAPKPEVGMDGATIGIVPRKAVESVLSNR